MAEIEVDGDAYDAVRATLAEAAQALSSARGKLAGAVPGMAFGPIGAFIPPTLNAVGAAVDAAVGYAGSVSRRTADGIQAAVAGFHEVDESGRADLERISNGG